MAGPSSTAPMKKVPSSVTAGCLPPFSIEGPLGNERYRLVLGMTDADRAYRNQWLKDQILAESEPRIVPGLYEARFNPIRRFYRYPLDKLFGVFDPNCASEARIAARWLTGKMLLGMWMGFGGIYYFKYHHHKWWKRCGWRVGERKPYYLPGDPGYGKPYPRSQPRDYADYGFKNSPI